MFALEIGFKGESPTTETIFVRRPTALVSAADSAHVVIDDMASLGYGIRVTRELGRRFRVSPEAESPTSFVPDFLDAVYDGEALLDLGTLELRVTALDIDLAPKESESPDRAGVRVLRQSCAGSGPRFPAVVLNSTPPCTISFVPEQPLMVGRSRQCALRVDTSRVSDRHARIGFESGSFWVEDLGSTNGTFVNKQQISGRTDVQPGQLISLAHEVSIVGILSGDAVSSMTPSEDGKSERPVFTEERYPILKSVSEMARPAQLVLTPGVNVVVGRDPSSDMWLGVPHVSRRHCAISLSASGVVSVTDMSTNGTGYDGGVLRKDEVEETDGWPVVLDFGAGVTVAICFSAQDVQRFVSAGGAPTAFSYSFSRDDSAVTGLAPRDRRGRSRTTFLRTPEELRQAAEAVAGAGRMQQFFARLTVKGRWVLIGVIAGAVMIASVIIGSLILGMT